jgi:hypothetical protein
MRGRPAYCTARPPARARSRDGLSWSPIFSGAFGPTARLSNGSTARLGYVERPQIAQDKAGGPPLALFLGTGYTHRSYTWAQRFCDVGRPGLALSQ